MNRVNEIRCDPDGFEWAKPKKHKNVWHEDTGCGGVKANLAAYDTVDDGSL